MPEENVVAWLRSKFGLLENDLDERGRRRWAATEALSLGRGGIAAVSEATGLSERAIRNGRHHLTGGGEVEAGAKRKGRAGTKIRGDEHTELVCALQNLLGPTNQG